MTYLRALRLTSPDRGPIMLRLLGCLSLSFIARLHDDDGYRDGFFNGSPGVRAILDLPNVDPLVRGKCYFS